MGGWGSGRTGGRPLADTALFVDIAWMVRTRRAIPGSNVWGSLSWTRGGEPNGYISYECDMTNPENGTLKLKFTVIDRWRDEKRKYEQIVPLSYTVPHFGGKRWWMHCPHNGSRVGKLYCPAGADTFASRTAWRIGYKSQRETASDRAFSRLSKLQSKLGGYDGYDEPIWRPKGMWRSTYAKYEERYWDLRDQADYEWCLMVAKLTRLGDRLEI